MGLDAMTQALPTTSDDDGEFHAAFNEKRRSTGRGAEMLRLAEERRPPHRRDRAVSRHRARLRPERLAPHVAEWYDEGTLPDDLGRLFGKYRPAGTHLEGHYGCACTSATAYGVARRGALEAVDTGLRASSASGPPRCSRRLHRWGSEQHKEEWPPGWRTARRSGASG